MSFIFVRYNSFFSIMKMKKNSLISVKLIVTKVYIHIYPYTVNVFKHFVPAMFER